jgi:hypothetical protein
MEETDEELEKLLHCPESTGPARALFGQSPLCPVGSQSFSASVRCPAGMQTGMARLLGGLVRCQNGLARVESVIKAG